MGQDRQDEKVSHTKPGRLRNDDFLVLGTGLLECIGLVEVLGSIELIEFIEVVEFGEQKAERSKRKARKQVVESAGQWAGNRAGQTASDERDWEALRE